MPAALSPDRGVAAFGDSVEKETEGTNLRNAPRVSFLSESARKVFPEAVLHDRRRRRYWNTVSLDVFERYRVRRSTIGQGIAPRKETVSNGFLEARSKRNARDQVLINLSIVLAKARGERRERR